MKTEINTRSCARWVTCLVLTLFSTSLAATAQAGLYFDHIPPSVCKSSSPSYITENRIEYEGGSIGVDESSNVWDFDVVVCPISRFRPGDEMREIRIKMEGGTLSYNWCQLYESPDFRNILVHRRTSSSGDMIFDSPTASTDDGRVGITARCLLTPGTSISAIAILWDI